MLFEAHYRRLFPAAEAEKRMQRLLAAMRQQRMSLAFEMVTASHGQHGQVPAAEYLVTTSANVISDSGRPCYAYLLVLSQNPFSNC